MPTSGVYAASLTPLHADGSIDTDAWAAHVRWLLDHGCTGVVLFGTTGEANSFSVEERAAALEALLNEGLPAKHLVVGTGCAAVPGTIALTRHALDHGVADVLMLPPFYYKDVSDEGLFQAFEQVIQGAGDERLRIILYHFPRMSGVPLSLSLIARLTEAYPSIVAGVKDSTGNWAHTWQLCSRFPDAQIFAGTEALLRNVLEAGGAGCISATVNVTSPLAGRVFDRWPEDDAHTLQQELTAIRHTIAAYPTIPALKQIMAWHHDDPDWLHLRPPLTSLSITEAKTLRNALADIELPLGASA